MKLYAFDIADRLGLHRPLRNMEIKNIVTDSRQVEENTLFCALVGEKSDGHDYISELDKKFKNVMFLVSKPIKTVHGTLLCRDVLTALADIAKLYLETLDCKRVAVTGSVGKTTTKEMIDCTLSAKFRVQKSLANRNNELGMPLTAFSVNEEHQVAIFEMGMRGLGQIDYLARRVKAHIGVITNIGVSHIELLGSRENICKAKMELADHIVAGGVLLINGDEPLLRQAVKEHTVRYATFGIDQPADYYADDIVMDHQSIRYCLHHGQKEYRISLPGSGKHMVYDSLSAFAVANEMGVASEDIIAALATYQDGGLRQHIYEQDGVLIFDDTYNAAPESMQAALGVMSAYPNRKIAVLADMLELGDYAPQAHVKVGESAAQNGVDQLICYGEYAQCIAEGYGQGAVICKDRAGALEQLLPLVKEKDIILFKGSHSMQCDKLLQEFSKRWKNK